VASSTIGTSGRSISLKLSRTNQGLKSSPTSHSNVWKYLGLSHSGGWCLFVAVSTVLDGEYDLSHRCLDQEVIPTKSYERVGVGNQYDLFNELSLRQFMPLEC
jgi:hypothetical protein